jgi:molybdenum cofactor cytidylyltransferase
MSDLWGILLAAGSAQRFGGDKLLHPLDNNLPLAVVAARRLLRVLPNSAAVVRSDCDELAGLLRAEGMGLVVNPDAARGMGASLACGVRATACASGWVVALADMPWIAEDTVRGVVRLLHAGADIAAPVHQGQRGHPVGFSHALRPGLEQLDGDQGARALLEQHAGRLSLFEINDPGCLADVDTRDDLHATAGRGDA